MNDTSLSVPFHRNRKRWHLLKQFFINLFLFLGNGI
jgi:hypothetical protein